MDTMSGAVWQRKGSSIIFDKNSLSPFVKQGAFISLRQALRWTALFPSDPPVVGKTILIYGLETMLETLPADDLDEYLLQRIRPLIIEVQNRWTEFGLVFGFSSHPNAFEENQMSEEALFKRRDRVKVRLSQGIWGDSASLNMKRIVAMDKKKGQEAAVGYYVARLS